MCSITNVKYSKQRNRQKNTKHPWILLKQTQSSSPSPRASSPRDQSSFQVLVLAGRVRVLTIRVQVEVQVLVGRVLTIRVQVQVLGLVLVGRVLTIRVQVQVQVLVLVRRVLTIKVQDKSESSWVESESSRSESKSKS